MARYSVANGRVGTAARAVEADETDVADPLQLVAASPFRYDGRADTGARVALVDAAAEQTLRSYQAARLPTSDPSRRNALPRVRVANEPVGARLVARARLALRAGRRASTR